MLKTDIDSVTSTTSGFPKEYLTDNNPDTWWKKSSGSGAQQFLVFDKNDTTTTIDALVLFVHNYKAVTSNVIGLMHDDNSGFSSATPSLSNQPISDTATPIRVYDFGSSSAERYWRLQLPNADIQLSMVLLCKKFTVSQGREFPITDNDDFATQTLAAPGGRQHVIIENQNVLGSRTDKFKLSGTTNYNALRNAFLDCKKNGLPVIRQPGSTNATAEIGRFSRAKFIRTQSDYQYYQPSVTIELMPYIASGESY